MSIVPILKPGKNSLDFLLVLYLGYLVAKSKKARFVIVAADKDYDSAIDHARAEGVDVVRVPELPVEVSRFKAAIPRKKGAAEIGKVSPPRATAQTPTTVGAPDLLPSKKEKTTSRVYAGTLKDIQGPNRPGDLESLRNRIQSRAGKAANPKTVADVLARLETMDVIRIVNGAVVYLPGRPGSLPAR